MKSSIIKALLISLIIHLFICNVLKSQEKDTIKLQRVEFQGFVNYEIMYDTRQTIALREGEVCYFPKPAEYDRFGKDINDNGKLYMFSMHSRLKADIKGPEFRNFKTCGVIEFDFVGKSEGLANSVRLRLAYFKIISEKIEWLLGHHWHPMSGTECSPGIVSWGSAAPVNMLNRSPQIKLTYKPSKIIAISATALTQQDFTSSGPNGNSSEYIKNSKIPEMQLQLTIKPKENYFFGFTGGYKVIAPRLVTDSNYVNKELIGSYNFNIFGKFANENFEFKFETVYGQNLNHLKALGGYAVSQVDTELDQRKYLNISTFAAWTEFVYKINNFELGLFTGYTKNLGLTKSLPQIFDVYGSASNINYVYKIMPRIIYRLKKLKFGLELNSTAASYGYFANDLRIVNDTEVINHRFLFSTSFLF